MANEWLITTNGLQTLANLQLNNVKNNHFIRKIPGYYMKNIPKTKDRGNCKWCNFIAQKIKNSKNVLNQ